MGNELTKAILKAIGMADKPADTIRVSPVSGGSINRAYRLEVGGRRFFAKVNSAGKHPLMFELEANGLRALRVEGGPRIPDVIATGYADDDAFLVLEWIEPGKKPVDFGKAFGKQLATLHRQTHKLFGWEEDNYIGSLFQSNGRLRNWPEFYMINRLDPQVEMAFNNGLLSKQHIRWFNVLYGKLEELIPQEIPALIHGDLWGGNYLVDESGQPILIDPAVYYGHREMDLGMMQLFGGFDQSIFEAYNRHFPLEKGWEDRIPLNQLYPLLVHVNLFGSGYVGQVERAVKLFI
jgi:protein-ribulosamine 3-kinase